MVATVQAGCTYSLADAYREFDTALRVRNAKICCVLGLVLVPACISLDLFTYPGLVWPLLRMRIIHDLVMIPLFALMFTRWGRRNIGWLQNTPTVLPGLAICWMIYATEGEVSPYYAGLNLIFTGVMLLIPYTLAEATMCCGCVMLMYAIACLMHHTSPPVTAVRGHSASTAASLITNLVFLMSTATIACTACHYNGIRRFEDFRLRHELDVNNHELASTLSKLKETEVQLVQSEKMNALGKLSAGLLHEVNNPLNFTFMALQVAQQEAGDNESLKDTLNDISQGMDRIKCVISDLRGFAYPSKLQHPEPFGIEEALVSALRLVAHELGDIPVDRPEPPPEKVFGVKSQVVHIFMNLIINSAHALKSKDLGRAPRIAVTWEMADERLKIGVRDNGTGVPAAILPRLFEPFFTTKDVGQGTGLGLSICHTIVKNHGGAISVASQEGQWTQVSFDLPLATAGSFV